MTRALTLSFVAALSSLCGCLGTPSGYLRERSAIGVGCPADEVIATNDRTGVNGHTWSAECRGRRFICHESALEPVNCKEELKP